MIHKLEVERSQTIYIDIYNPSNVSLDPLFVYMSQVIFGTTTSPAHTAFRAQGTAGYQLSTFKTLVHIKHILWKDFCRS